MDAYCNITDKNYRCIFLVWIKYTCLLGTPSKQFVLQFLDFYRCWFGPQGIFTPQYIWKSLLTMHSISLVIHCHLSVPTSGKYSIFPLTSSSCSTVSVCDFSAPVTNQWSSKSLWEDILTKKHFAAADGVLSSPYQADWWKANHKTPTKAPVHCLTDLLGLVGLPMFMNLKVSACHWLADGLLCCVTDVRKTLKANLHSQKDEWGFKEWEEQRKGDASSSLGSLWLTDVLDSSSNSLMGSMEIYI